MKGPFILFEGNEILIFRIKDEVERYVESPDIEIYDLFDSCGAQLSFSLNTSDVVDYVSAWIVKIVPVTVEDEFPTPQSIDNFISRLKFFLARYGRASDEKSMKDLIEDVVSITGYHQ